MANTLTEDINVERGLRTAVLGTTREARAGAGIVPVIDMTDEPEKVTAAMWEAASTVGFFTLKNHGIPKATIDAAFEASGEFFAQDREVKTEQSPFAAHLNSGYEFMSQVRPSTGTADQKESLQITARNGAMDGRWPAEPKALQTAARALLEASHELACHVLNRLEPRACPELKPGTLAGSHKLWSDDGQCTLRLLHYPPTAPPEENPDPLAPQLWRAGPHTDWCCVTLLYQRPGDEGLECAANPRKGSDQGWLTVDPVEGGIAVNIGDMLSRWSDGRLLSNLHRVRMPTKEECNPPRSRCMLHSTRMRVSPPRPPHSPPANPAPISCPAFTAFLAHVSRSTSLMLDCSNFSFMRPSDLVHMICRFDRFLHAG